MTPPLANAASGVDVSNGREAGRRAGGRRRRRRRQRLEMGVFGLRSARCLLSYRVVPPRATLVGVARPAVILLAWCEMRFF